MKANRQRNGSRICSVKKRIDRGKKPLVFKSWMGLLRVLRVKPVVFLNVCPVL